MRILSGLALAGLLVTACTDDTQGPLLDAVDRVTIEPDSIELVVGSSRSLTATMYSRYGQVLQARSVAWTMNVSDVVSLEGGTVTGVAEGVVTLTATSEGKSGRAVVVVRSAPGTGDPIAIQTSALAEAIEGQAYNQQLEAVGGSGSYSWVLAAGSLPAGMMLSPTGMIAGTPVGPGTASFRVRVTDSADLTAIADLSIPVVQTLAVHSWRLPDAEVGQAYTAQLQAVGGRGTLTWTVTGEAATWMTVSASGVITGTPVTPGAQTVMVGVADESGQQASRQIPLVVRAPLAVVAISLPAATQGRAYAAQLVATGGDGVYSWSLQNGVLPPGVVLTAGGALTGTPTDGGEFSFTVQVTDGADRVATRDLTLTVDRAPTIQTGLLPAGDFDSPYAAQLQATGGTGAYTWSVIEGALPAGLTLSSGGTISGTPVTMGSSTFTVRVADVAGATHSRAFAIVIARIDALSNGVAVTGIEGAAGSSRYYSIVVPTSATQLTFATSGGTGDVDLYIRHGSLPQEYVYDCRPFRPGNQETCTITSPTAGHWFVMLRGHGDYADVRLVASYE